MRPDIVSCAKRWATLLTVGASVWVLSITSAPASSMENVRDPFVFGPRSDAAVHVTSAEQVLVGILWDAAHPLAIIGDQTVGVGDTVSGWQVTGIQQNGVEIQRGDRRELLAPGSSMPSD